MTRKKIVILMRDAYMRGYKEGLKDGMDRAYFVVSDEIKKARKRQEIIDGHDKTGIS